MCYPYGGDDEWTGRLRMMRSCFEQGKIREYWESDLELEKWFDPLFEGFINNEILQDKSKAENKSKAANVVRESNAEHIDYKR